MPHLSPFHRMISPLLRAGSASRRSGTEAPTPRFPIALALAILFAFSLAVAAQPQTVPVEKKGALEKPRVEFKDRDNDGLPDCEIETPRLRLMLSSKTGDIAVWFLKGSNFEENLYPPMLADLGYKFASGTLQPFTVSTAGAPEAAPPTGYSLRADDSPADRIVVSATANAPTMGLSLIKRYTFPLNSYSFETEVIVTNLGDADRLIGTDQTGGLTWWYGPGIFLDPFAACSFLALKKEGQDVYDNVDALRKAASSTSYVGIGLKSTFFCVLMDADAPVKLHAETFEFKSDDPKKKTFNGELIGMSLPPFTLRARESRPFRGKFYYGPKILDELTAINRQTVTDYGFLSTMLLRILQGFNSIYPNYGLSIIFLTIIVRILLYPLTLSQTKSMARMQKLQPLIQDLKDRFADNPQKFNEEVLKLYQKHEVNPLGGCLPLFLQLPVFIALYNTLSISVEMRKASFLWMTDLSKADPLLILPIVIAALMYYQQGQMNDPQAQQMMAFMPMFMFVITWSLPAGLLLYWFTSSVIGIVQQFQANQLMKAVKEEPTSHATHTRDHR